MQILKARIVAPVGSPPIENGVVCVEDSRITGVGAAANFPNATEDLGAVVLAPGLINAHCHLDYTALRGAIPPPDNFPDWIRRINALKGALSAGDYLASIAEGFSELRRWGTTTVFNIEAFPDLMPRMPPPPLRTWWFHELIDIRQQINAEDVAASADGFFENHPDWRGGFGLSPHAPYTASPALYETSAACSETRGIPWMTHLAETEEEFAMFHDGAGPLHDFLRSFGRPMDDCGGTTPVRRLFEGRGGPRGAILTHMNFLAEADYELLAARRADISVVHCPKCHEYFGRPRFEIERLRALDISVCLGTDSLASNTGLNLFEEMRTLRRGHPDLAAAEIIDMVTRRPARAIGRHGELGVIKPGAQADLIAVPYAGSVKDVLEGILENRSEIEWMMIGGGKVCSFG